MQTSQSNGSQFSKARSQGLVEITDFLKRAIVIALVLNNTINIYLIRKIVNQDVANQTFWHRISDAGHEYVFKVYRSTKELQQFVVAMRNFEKLILRDLINMMSTKPGENID